VPAMFPHPNTDRHWISGQANFIFQWHPEFDSPYSGRNSLSSEAQSATSRVLTLFTGLRLTSTSELLCDIQETGGPRLGRSAGAGRFHQPRRRSEFQHRTGAVRGAPDVAPDHSPRPVEGEQLLGVFTFSTPHERRIEFRFGKLSMPDFIDANSYGTDSNLQFHRRNRPASEWLTLAQQVRLRGLRVCLQRHFARSPAISGARRIKLSLGQWPLQLRSRKHSRDLLHAARLARIPSFLRFSICRSSGLRTRPGARLRSDTSPAHGVLTALSCADDRL
jgi:hypothetical protein